MNNMLISSSKKDEAFEDFAKSKREELEKMIPGFVDDRKFTGIVLNFYERGIREGIQMMKEQIMKDAFESVVQTNSMSGNTVVVHLDCRYKAGDKVKVIIIKED